MGVKKRIYLDYATTTPLDPQVLRAMKPYLSKIFGNPESLHTEGVRAAKSLKESRERVARLLEAHEDEIVFTSGGTESNNIAVLGLLAGIVKNAQGSTNVIKQHVITSVIEHPSVLETMRTLEQKGVSVTYVPVDKEGIIDLDFLTRSLRVETVVVSVMYANNEIGTIQPVRKISALLRESAKTIPYTLDNRPLLHTDACQAPLYLLVNQNNLGADLISLDGHKMYGPKGVGALYIRRGVKIAPLVHGGGQERGLRPGTVSVPLVVGFAEAFSIAAKRRAKETKRLAGLRDYFLREAQRMFPKATVNGSVTNRLANNVNLAFAGLDAEFAVLQLDALGIACSAKSACLEGERDSYVIKSLGRGDGTEHSSLRFTLGRATTKQEIGQTLRAIREVCNRQKT